jgi:hypothetical protein
VRPSKITPAIRARCREVALLKLKTPTYKELEIETGIHHNYLAKVVHEIVLEECSTLGTGPLEPEPEEIE